MAKSKPVVRAAVAQLPAFTLSEHEQSLAAIAKAFEQAAEAGAQLLICPECAYPAYLVRDLATYRQGSQLSSDRFLDELCRMAKAHRMLVVCGFVEEQDERLFNSAAVIGSEGRRVGVARKSFLWGTDVECFTPGEGIAAFDTEHGRLGIAICADVRAPEILAALVDQGAEMIAVPTCWVTVRNPRTGWLNPQPEVLVPARVHEFRVPFLCANKFGAEGEAISYCGLSRIVEGDGSVVAEAPVDREALLIGDIVPRTGVTHKVPTWAAARILTSEPPIRLNVEEPDEAFTLAIFPDSMVDRTKGTFLREGVVDELLAHGAAVVIANAHHAKGASDFELRLRALGMNGICEASDHRVMYEVFGTYGCVKGKSATSFAPLRALALDGAALLVAFDAPECRPLLQARAIENRCFVAATFAHSAMLIHPDGTILGELEPGSERPLMASISLNEAAQKEVFPRTDIWDQRRPAVYAAAMHMGLDV